MRKKDNADVGDEKYGIAEELKRRALASTNMMLESFRNHVAMQKWLPNQVTNISNGRKRYQRLGSLLIGSALIPLERNVTKYRTIKIPIQRDGSSMLVLLVGSPF